MARQGSIDQAILKRFRSATGSFEEAVAVVELVLPTLEKGVQSRPVLIDLLKEVVIYLKDEQLEQDALIGKLKEAVPALREAKYDMAAIETLQAAKGYYETGDIQTIKRLIEGFDLPAIEDALLLVSASNLDKMELAVTQAKLRRQALE